MIRWLRNGWVALNFLIATISLAILISIIGLFDRKSKRWVSMIARLWARWVLWPTGIKITVHGSENLTPGQNYIFMGNHSSALDIPVALLALPGPIVFMAKQELFRIPLFGWSVWAMGSIPVNRSNREQARASVDRAAEILKNSNLSLLCYPEGTRTRSGELLPFKRGVFHVAIRSGLPLAIVGIRGTYEALPPNVLDLTPTQIHVTIDHPLDTTQYSIDERNDLLLETRRRLEALLAKD